MCLRLCDWIKLKLFFTRGTAMQNFKKILIPTDMSELSLTALEFVNTHSEFLNAEIYIIHVIEKVDFPVYYTVDLYWENMQKDVEDRAKEKLKTVIEKYFPERKDQIKRITVKGNPSDKIVELAKKEKIELIIMATHGRTGLEKILIGSVAERVVRNSPIPVLTLKPQKIINNNEK